MLESLRIEELHRRMHYLTANRTHVTEGIEALSPFGVASTASAPSFGLTSYGAPTTRSVSFSSDVSYSSDTAQQATTYGDASTTVEMRDGESFAIAGLLQDDFRDLNSQVPWLGDVPVLGALFRSAEYQREQTELVIIITPHLVTPTRGEALALPTDRVQPPTESDLFLFGRVAAENAPSTGGAGEVARQDFSGSYGYVLDD